MADPLATVEKIVKLGLKIKDAVDTVRHNQEECNEIRRRVLRFSDILSQLQQTGVMEASPALSGALEDLEDSLQHALELVTACQETSTIRRLITAGDLSKQLRRVKEDIFNKVMLASFAINAHTIVVLLTIQTSGHPHPPPRQPEDAGVVEISHSSQSTDDARSEFNGVENNVFAGCEESVAPLLVALREFSWSELKAATNGFSDDNIIGRGGFFIVYKGVLKDGSIVAVKKNNTNYYSIWQHDLDQFLVHVSKLQHRNIVKFVGYSHEVLSTSVVHLFKRKKGRANKGTKFIWVEEYVPNGTLEDLLRGFRDSQLDWSSLFRIIEGVAEGVQYLHEQGIVHMDVKPGSILLDSDMNAIISDFSISLALGDYYEITTDSIAGTVGYMDPEYLERTTLSTKNDVYGFGITLLETVGSIRRSRAPSDHYRFSDQWMWAWKAQKAGRIDEEFDPSLFDGSQLTEIKRCVEVGLLCTQRDREDRPTMTDVLEMLHGGHKELAVPKIPPWLEFDSCS